MQVVGVREEGREPDKAQQSGLRNVKVERIFIEVNILLSSVSHFPSHPQGHIFDLHTQTTELASRERRGKQGGWEEKERRGRWPWRFSASMRGGAEGQV